MIKPSGLSLDQFSDEQLLDALRGRGLILSVWREEDLAFLDEDDDLADLSQEQVDGIKLLVLERCGRGLLDVLGARGNAFTEQWWAQHKTELLAEAKREAHASACDRG